MNSACLCRGCVSNVDSYTSCLQVENQRLWPRPYMKAGIAIGRFDKHANSITNFTYRLLPRPKLQYFHDQGLLLQNTPPQEVKISRENLSCF